MDPAATEADPPAARAVQQVVPEQAPNVLEDNRVAGGVKTMAPVVDAQPGQVKAAGVATDSGVALEHGHFRQPPSAELKGGADPGRPGSKDNDVWPPVAHD